MDKLAIVLERIKLYHPRQVILFGSWATGEQDEYSDLDLVVIKDTDRRFLERLIDVSDFIGLDIDKVDVFVYTPEEWQRMIEWGSSFAEEVMRTGRIIYETG